ncbi:MAG TPA: phosphatidylglycerophosphatase A [Gammaproteobacteria bacterium]|nr:phosphatidylglycerophosphatase A [Gammaproteobacteria bacterium]
MTERIPVRRLLHPVDFLALGFGSGLVPRAPGTAGTVAAIPVYLLLQPLAMAYYAAIVFLLALAGIAICGHTASRLGVHDHPGIVWDEIVGYLVTMAFAPPGWLWIVVGFVLFRLFDIAKPWPIRWFDRQVGGGLGIMLDDLLAGMFSALLLLLMVRYL